MRKQLLAFILIAALPLMAQEPSLQNDFNREYAQYTKYSSQRNFIEALPHAKKALTLAEKIWGKNHVTTGAMADRTAYVELSLGNYARALELYNRVKDIYIKEFGKEHQNVAIVYMNMGEAHRAMGDYTRALEFHALALSILEKSLGKNHEWVGTIANFIGGVHKSTGNYSEAIHWYNRALKIYQKILSPGHQFIGTTYVNIGGAYAPQGKHRLALKYYKKAEKIYMANLGAHHPFMAVLYNNQGVSNNVLKRYREAASYYYKALKIYRKNLGENHPYVAVTLTNIGIAHQKVKEYLKAVEKYNQAMEIFRKSSQRDKLIQLKTILAKCYLEMGKNDKAESQLNDALEFLNDFRLTMGRTKSGLTSKYGPLYTSYVSLLLKKGDIPGAFKKVSERKGLSISEEVSLQKALEKGKVPSSKRKAFLALERRVMRIETERNKALLSGEGKRADRLSNELFELDRKMKHIDSKLLKEYPAYGVLRSPKHPSPGKLQSVLKPHEIIINYIITDDEIGAFVLSRKGTLAYILLVKGKEKVEEVKTILKGFHSLCSVPSTSSSLAFMRTADKKKKIWRKEGNYKVYNKVVYTRGSLTSSFSPGAGGERGFVKVGKVEKKLSRNDILVLRKNYSAYLYTLLLNPILKKVKGRKLVIIPDGVLYYLPFNILNNSRGKMLGDSHQISLIQSSTVWYNLRRRAHISFKHNLLAFGNAIYGKGYTNTGRIERGRERSAVRSGGELSNLPGTGEEVKIISTITYGKRWKKYTRTGIMANEDLIFSYNTSRILRQYRVLHLAAHGVLSDSDPKLSAVVLTSPESASRYAPGEMSRYLSGGRKLVHDGYLRVGEIKTMTISADLVILSACDSSLGHLVTGEGMIGLPQAFLIAGSRSVLATLWSVDDEAASIFMEEFYRQLFKKKKSYHGALKKAASVVREEYSDPYYWAPFIFYGE